MRTEPSVLHLDADAFFAAVEQRQKPSLRGRPVVVGGVGPRGVVATASYEARAFGVGSAMPTGRARAACPTATVLAPRFAAYSAHSSVLLDALRELSPLVEPVSLDEAFVDLAAGEVPDPVAAADRVRRTIWNRTGLVVSVGLGRSKLVAKLASDARKPNGFTVVREADEDAFLLPLPVSRLWGVGPATEETLRVAGVLTVADLRRADERELVRLLGVAHGTSLHRLARGRDERAVVPEREAKSLGAERTFAVDVTGSWAQREQLDAVLAAALPRLTAHGGAARTVTVKARFADFRTVTRAVSAPQPTADPGLIREAARAALAAAVPEGEPVRLLGVSLSALSPFAQLPLALLDDEPAGADGPGLDVAAEPVPSADHLAPGRDVRLPDGRTGWLVRAAGGTATVRVEGPATAPGVDEIHPVDGLEPADPPPVTPPPRLAAPG